MSSSKQNRDGDATVCGINAMLGWPTQSADLSLGLSNLTACCGGGGGATFLTRANHDTVC